MPFNWIYRWGNIFIYFLKHIAAPELEYPNNLAEFLGPYRLLWYNFLLSSKQYNSADTLLPFPVDEAAVSVHPEAQGALLRRPQHPRGLNRGGPARHRLWRHQGVPQDPSHVSRGNVLDNLNFCSVPSPSKTETFPASDIKMKGPKI